MYEEFLEVDKKENIEISDKKNSAIIVQEIKETDFFQNHVENSFNSITLFYQDGERFHFQKRGLYAITPVIVRKIYRSLHFYNFTENPFTFSITTDNQEIIKEEVNEKYHEYRELEKGKNVKVEIKSSIGEYVYHFLPPDAEEKYDLKKKYELKDEEYDKILKFLYQLQDRHIIYLIAELKIYIFQYKKEARKILINLSDMVLAKIKKKYFTGKYFIYEPGAEFNTLDIVDILLHLKEIYKKGFTQLDKMIEMTFAHVKKVKLKDKRLQDYTKKKKFKLF